MGEKNERSFSLDGWNDFTGEKILVQSEIPKHRRFDSSSSLSSGGDSVRGKGRFGRPPLVSSGNKGVETITEFDDDNSSCFLGFVR